MNHHWLTNRDLNPPEDEVTGVTDEDRIVMEVEEYALAASGKKYSPTVQVRRVIKALRLIGLERSAFNARVVMDGDEYGPALGHIHEYADCKIVIKNARLLVRCGLNVHILNTDPGHESAFVSTPRYTAGQIIRYASVTSP